jgi:hypothetical protein
MIEAKVNIGFDCIVRAIVRNTRGLADLPARIGAKRMSVPRRTILEGTALLPLGMPT